MERVKQILCLHSFFQNAEKCPLDSKKFLMQYGSYNKNKVQFPVRVRVGSSTCGTLNVLQSGEQLWIFSDCFAKVHFGVCLFLFICAISLPLRFFLFSDE